MGKVWGSFKKAKKSLIIATPYFVPSKEMVKELKVALNRGVNVKILVPFKSDAILLKQVCLSIFERYVTCWSGDLSISKWIFHGK